MLQRKEQHALNIIIAASHMQLLHPFENKETSLVQFPRGGMLLLTY